MEFGKAKYKFDEKEKDSFFVKYKSKNGDIIDIWSEDLERVVKENDIKVGEYVRFKIVDKAPVEIKAKRFNKKTNRYTVYTKQTFKNVWDCSVQGRLEKDLKTVPKSKDKQVKYTSETIKNKNDEFFEKMKLKKEKEAQEKLNISNVKKPNKFANLKKKDDRDR